MISTNLSQSLTGIPRNLRTGLALGLLMTLVACGSAPKPRAELALSDAALKQAELAGAREYAPVELRLAREKNMQAHQAYSKDKMTTAKRLSEQALVDAEVAQAKASAEKSKVALEELREGINVMKAEILRVQGN